MINLVARSNDMMFMEPKTAVVVNNRGMVTIPKNIRERFNIHEGTRVVFVEIDGAIEVIPVRTVDEMEAACTIPRVRMSTIIDEDRAQELNIENDES